MPSLLPLGTVLTHKVLLAAPSHSTLVCAVCSYIKYFSCGCYTPELHLSETDLIFSSQPLEISLCSNGILRFQRGPGLYLIRKEPTTTHYSCTKIMQCCAYSHSGLPCAV